MSRLRTPAQKTRMRTNFIFYLCPNASNLKHEIGQVDAQYPILHSFYDERAYLSSLTHPLNIESKYFSRKNIYTELNAFQRVSTCKYMVKNKMCIKCTLMLFFKPSLCICKNKIQNKCCNVLIESTHRLRLRAQI